MPAPCACDHPSHKGALYNLRAHAPYFLGFWRVFGQKKPFFGPKLPPNRPKNCRVPQEFLKELFREVVVEKIDFLYNCFHFLANFANFANFCHFYSFWCIFTLHCGSVFGHFSDIFRICWDFLGDPRELFRRFWGNFDHFWAIFGPFWGRFYLFFCPHYIPPS